MRNPILFSINETLRQRKVDLKRFPKISEGCRRLKRHLKTACRTDTSVQFLLIMVEMETCHNNRLIYTAI